MDPSAVATLVMDEADLLLTFDFAADVRDQAMRGQRGRRCAGDGGERDGWCIRCRAQRGAGGIRER